MRTIVLKLAVVCVCGFWFGSCSTTPKITLGPGERLYAVKASKTPFFRYGPQQGNGADMQLPHDTLMTLIRPSFGYCKVHLITGEDGYVASEDIKEASPALVAALTAPPPPPPDTTSRLTGPSFNLDSTDPRLAVPPESLPEEAPEPTPLPGTSSPY